jgi:hypothetical protein
MPSKNITTAGDFLENQKTEEQKLDSGRTLGLWAVDGLIYPIINYGGVFALSVGSLYLGKHGDEVAAYFNEVAENNADDKLISGLSLVASWAAEGWKSRSSSIDNWLVDNGGMSRESAEITRMVITSFGDGCLFLPAVKWLEDRRIGLAKAIDNMAGTRPKDDSAYEAEPIKTWGDLIVGRAATAAIVVPTAVLLDKVPVNLFGKSQPLNQHLFYDQAENVQKFLQKNIPSVTDKLTDAQLNTISQNALFEAFYTMVCSVGLWGASAALAEKHTGHEKKNDDIEIFIDNELFKNNIVPLKNIKSRNIAFDGKAGKQEQQMVTI